MPRSRLRRLGLAAAASLAAIALIAGACGDDDDNGDDDVDTPVATQEAPGGITPAATEPGGDDTPATDGTAAADETPADGASATVSVAETDLGEVLVGPDGLTLYTFDNDTPGSGESACNEGCIAAWPALTVDGEPTAGEGVTGELGTITRADGDTQVTYNGAPLYYYVQDQAPGDTTGDGVGGVWHVATP